MPFIEWTQKHSVAVPEMDEQHRRLFDLTNDLHDAMRSGKGRDKLASALDQLTNYTMQHFAAEEQWMKRCSYPQLGDHMAEHRRLMLQVEDLRRKIADGETPSTANSFSRQKSSSNTQFDFDFCTPHVPLAQRVDVGTFRTLISPPAPPRSDTYPELRRTISPCHSPAEPPVSPSN